MHSTQATSSSYQQPDHYRPTSELTLLVELLVLQRKLAAPTCAACKGVTAVL
jgi:hypothetical protein